MLKEVLLSNFPNDGWLSEETADDMKRLRSQRIWIVDPIDGTKEFIKNIPEYAISVALVEWHEPILAAVYNPASGEIFYAIKGQGAWYNDKLINCDHSHPTKLHILASRTEFQAGNWDTFKNNHLIQEVGSIAYKLALVAAGKANATFSLVAKNEWDIAAGTLLVREAGGMVTQLDGSPVLFNQQNTLRSGIIACSVKLYSTMHSLVQATLRNRSLPFSNLR
jgi:myo-inositol-1(or 4)-monophosphatase